MAGIREGASAPYDEDDIEEGYDSCVKHLGSSATVMQTMPITVIT